jgi:hypothetical protein
MSYPARLIKCGLALRTAYFALRLLSTIRTFIVDVREPITPTTGVARAHRTHTHYGGAVSSIEAAYRCRIESAFAVCCEEERSSRLSAWGQ